MCTLKYLDKLMMVMMKIDFSLSLQVKTLCLTVALCCMFVANFTMLYVFNPVVQLVGVDGLFFLLAGIAAATAVISFLILPETSGLTTEEIQMLFEGFLQFRRKKRPAGVSM